MDITKSIAVGNSLNKDVGEWANNNGFQIDWESDGLAIWWEFYDQDELVLQIDKRIPLEEFFRIVSLLYKDMKRQDLPDNYFFAAKNMVKAKKLIAKFNKVITGSVMNKGNKYHNLFTQGYVAAVVCLINHHGLTSEAISVFRAGTGRTSLEKLKAEGVSQYDLEILKRHWQELKIKE